MGKLNTAQPVPGILRMPEHCSSSERLIHLVLRQTRVGPLPCRDLPRTLALAYIWVIFSLYWFLHYPESQLCDSGVFPQIRTPERWQPPRPHLFYCAVTLGSGQRKLSSTVKMSPHLHSRYQYLLALCIPPC